jgi:glycosyltransferase involved in cell wall biosynthesis
MESGLVTTIIPVFNRPRMLREAVASVLAQTYRPLEIVVVDDGSNDETPQVADELAAKHPEIQVIHQENRGVGPARESARLVSRGEFIQHLDSDDIIYPRKFEFQVAGLREHPECSISYGWTRVRFADGRLKEVAAKRTGEQIETLLPSMLHSRWWHTPTPLFRRELLDRAGPWLDLRVEEDWEYDVRLGRLGARLHYVPKWIAEVRHHAEQRLSGRDDPDVLRARARAHRLIYAHARDAGVMPAAPEMRHYSRELFHLSRQCASRGCVEDAQMLFRLAREASGDRGSSSQFRLYSAATKIFGWRLTGSLSEFADRLRW